MSLLDGWEWRRRGRFRWIYQGPARQERAPNTPQEPQERAPEAVPCSECGVMVLDRMAQSVSVGWHGAVLRYCAAHRKSYSKVQGDQRYYAELEVSEDGTPIGYVKEKVKP